MGFSSAKQIVAAAHALCTGSGGVISEQAAYNATLSRRLKNFHHRLHVVERWAFWILVVSLLGFLALYGVLQPWPSIGAAIFMLSSIVPAIAAASFALEAKLDVQNNVFRAEQLGRQLNELGTLMLQANSAARAQELSRIVSQVLISEADSWRDASIRRQIVMM